MEVKTIKKTYKVNDVDSFAQISFTIDNVNSEMRLEDTLEFDKIRLRPLPVGTEIKFNIELTVIKES